MLFRRAHLQDADGIFSLALESGIGITTLPKDRNLLEQRLDQSNNSFHPLIHTPGSEYYLFVMEDTSTKQIVGTAAIEALTGFSAPFYAYQYNQQTRTCPSLGIESTQDHLIVSYKNEGCSEVCTLYLAPAYRRNGNGLLLSLARFLFMAHFPTRFAPTVIAEMRGISDENGASPFWDAVGFPFFKMTFSKADQLTLLSNKQFIADLIPQYPIYINLLPKSAQSVIGQAHPSSVPAMSILLREGFTYNQTIDIFDAGPTISVARDQIRSFKNSQCMRVEITNKQLGHQQYLVANTELNFCAVQTNAQIDPITQTCQINPIAAQHLYLKNGSNVRILKS